MGASPGSVGLVIVAAGSSTRMAGMDKVRALLDGASVLAHSILNLSHCVVTTVVVAGPYGVPEDALAALRASGSSWTVVERAGADRQESVRLGLQALDRDVPIIAVHDAARPLAAHHLLLEGIERTRQWDGAIPGIPVTDTIKEIDPGGRVRGTVDRSRLCAVQTPQVFRAEPLREAHRSPNGASRGATDDALLLEGMGRTVGVYPGDPRNIKITTAMDLRLAEWLVKQRNTR